MGGGNDHGYQAGSSEEPAVELSVTEVRSLLKNMMMFEAPAETPAYERRDGDTRRALKALYLTRQRETNLRRSLTNPQLFDEVRDDLTTAMKTAKDPQVRIELLNIVRPLDMAAQLLSDPDDWVRLHAVECIVRSSRFDSSRSVVRGLRWLAPMVRDKACYGGISRDAAAGVAGIIRETNWETLRPNIPKLRETFQAEADKLHFWNTERLGRYRSILNTLKERHSENTSTGGSPGLRPKPISSIARS
jgi:hypothetical protein